MRTGNEMTLVSVVVACSRHPEVVGQAVDSVTKEDHREFEILVCGECWTADRAESVERLAVRPLPFHVGRVGVELNRALAECEGAFVVFLEASERLLPDALRAGLESLQAHPESAVAVGRHRRIRADGSVVAEAEPSRPITTDSYLELLRGEYTVDVPAAVLYRREALVAAGAFDASLDASLHFDLCARILKDSPACFHGVLIAEHRSDRSEPEAAARFSSSLQVLRSHRKHLVGNRHYSDAYRAGVRHLARSLAFETVEELRRDLRRREWGRAGSSGRVVIRYLATLLRRHPLGLLPVVVACLGPPVSRRSSWARRIERCTAQGLHGAQTTSLHRLREAARARVPPHATVVVVGAADSEQLRLDGRRVVPLALGGKVPPGGDDGSAPAARGLVTRLEWLRAEGAEFALVPNWAFWWLDYYCPDFKRYLDAGADRVWADQYCTIYRLPAPTSSPARRALVAGFFSFRRGAATAGDLLARDVTCEWLDEAGLPYDVAVAPPFVGGVDWRAVDPRRYSHLIFVCGPFLDDRGQRALLGRFPHCRLLGLNLSMLAPGGRNPFDVLLERDSPNTGRPDITLCSSSPKVPVVGFCLREHAEGTREAHAAIRRLLNGREMSVVEIDTRLDTNTTGLRSAAEVESLLARMDVVVTTRLHGMVLALRNGVPVIAIDPQPGGQKIRRQAETIGWPLVFNGEALTDESLQEAFSFCLTPAAREAARECADAGAKALRQVRLAFTGAL
ncbi:MAG TPA: polysaccharide pyruvyl transferase family protein [Acidimicrobiales bacterium]|nr:polysaccharide pyruvyl transferase family protein [Acidimicrobiales bacterium]